MLGPPQRLHLAAGRLTEASYGHTAGTGGVSCPCCRCEAGRARQAGGTRCGSGCGEGEPGTAGLVTITCARGGGKAPASFATARERCSLDQNAAAQPDRAVKNVQDDAAIAITQTWFHRAAQRR